MSKGRKKAFLISLFGGVLLLISTVTSVVLVSFVSRQPEQHTTILGAVWWETLTLRGNHLALHLEVGLKDTREQSMLVRALYEVLTDEATPVAPDEIAEMLDVGFPPDWRYRDVLALMFSDLTSIPLDLYPHDPVRERDRKIELMVQKANEWPFPMMLKSK